MTSLIVSCLVFGALQAREANAALVTRYTGKITGYDEIWAANAGQTVEVDDIKEVANDRPTPYRVRVTFVSKKPSLRLVVLKNDVEIANQILTPTGGVLLNRTWTTYLIEADGLIFQVGINPAGKMPVNVLESRGHHQCIMFGTTQLKGPTAKCGS